MDIKDIKAVYFAGIGGIGMSAIARYFLNKGLVVGGYDKTPSALISCDRQTATNSIFLSWKIRA